MKKSTMVVIALNFFAIIISVIMIKDIDSRSDGLIDWAATPYNE